MRRRRRPDRRAGVYATAPPSLNFGVVAAGRTFQRTIEFSNEGTLACHLAVETTGELVSVEGGPASVELAPGGTATFTMTVGGVCDDCEGALLAQINGELAEQVYASRTTGTSDGVLLLPAVVDFGSVCVGDTPRGRQVTVYNTSATARTIDRIALESGGAVLSANLGVRQNARTADDPCRAESAYPGA